MINKKVYFLLLNIEDLSDEYQQITQRNPEKIIRQLDTESLRGKMPFVDWQWMWVVNGDDLLSNGMRLETRCIGGSGLNRSSIANRDLLEIQRQSSDIELVNFLSELKT